MTLNLRTFIIGAALATLAMPLFAQGSDNRVNGVDTFFGLHSRSDNANDQPVTKVTETLNGQVVGEHTTQGSNTSNTGDQSGSTETRRIVDCIGFGTGYTPGGSPIEYPLFSLDRLAWTTTLGGQYFINFDTEGHGKDLIGRSLPFSTIVYDQNGQRPFQVNFFQTRGGSDFRVFAPTQYQYVGFEGNFLQENPDSHRAQDNLLEVQFVAVPEPSAIVALAAGAGLLFRRRRR